jgi:hypothetical protein
VPRVADLADELRDERQAGDGTDHAAEEDRLRAAERA